MHDDPTISPRSDPTLSPIGGDGILSSGRDESAWPGFAHEDREPPTTWGSFKLLARVGEGGFGEVYRAWDPSLEREVALKLLLPGTAQTQQADQEYKTLLHEARTLAAIQHPNIVRVYGIDRHDGRVGFWTDFVKGRTLSSLVSAQGPFGYREAAVIVLDITRALSAVHRTDILHRDIKAENVMREEGGRILLMDFGVSVLTHRETGVAGTPHYMAPELWQGSEATVQTDIYAMGVLLYYLVTGQHPIQFDGTTKDEITTALANRRPLMDLRSDLPESFLRTVSTAMDDDPRKRFTSAGRLAAALSDVLGTAPPVEPDPNRAFPTGRKGFVLAIGTAILVLVVPALYKTVKQWVDPQPTATSVSVPGADMSDDYQKAQDLLQHAYLDANLAAAVTGFQHVLDKDPNNALAEASLGAALFAEYGNSSDRKLLDQAKAAIARSLVLDPNLAPAYATRARMEAMAGHTSLALQQAQKAIALDPHNPEAHAALADVYDAQGKESDAIEAIQQAIDLAPDNPTWLNRQGYYYNTMGNSAEAAEAWKKAVAIDPRNVPALYNLGIVDLRAGKLEEARSYCEKVLQVEPDADSYKTLATISLLQGNYKDAIATDTKSLSINPNSYQAWGNLAGAYAWSGDRPNALENYKKAIDLAKAQSAMAPEDAGMIADLADYYASIGDAAHSLPLVRKALALAPKDTEVAYVAGESYELLGRRENAIPLIARAIAAGYQTNLFQRSPEMASLRSDPAFQAALAAAKSENAVDMPK